jgi:universal stress protein A
MAKRILIPLGPRESAHEIVPLVADLAQASGGSVRLLRVYPVPSAVLGPYDRVIAYPDQEMQRLTHAGLDELRTAEARFHDVPVESVVRFGNTVQEVLSEADAFDADLIALATERRGRLRRAVARGVAERLIDKSPVPTLVLRA